MYITIHGSKTWISNKINLIHNIIARVSVRVNVLFWWRCVGIFLGSCSSGLWGRDERLSFIFLSFSQDFFHFFVYFFINRFIITLFRNATPCELINTKVSKETPLSSYCALQTELHVPPKRWYLYTSPQVLRNLRWICLVNVVMKFRGPWKARNFFPNGASVYFSRRSLIHEVSSSLWRNYYCIKLKVLFKSAFLCSSSLVFFSILNYLYVFEDMKIINTQNYNSVCCYVWMWYLVFHI